MDPTLRTHLLPVPQMGALKGKAPESPSSSPGWEDGHGGPRSPVVLEEHGQSSSSGAPGHLAGAGVRGSWAWAVAHCSLGLSQGCVAGPEPCPPGDWHWPLLPGPVGGTAAPWARCTSQVGRGRVGCDSVRHELAQRKPPAVWSGRSVNGICWGSGEPAPYTSFHGALFVTKKARGKRWVHCLLPGDVRVLLSCDKGPGHRPPQPVSFPELCGWVMAWTTWRQQWERGAALSPQGVAGAWCPGPRRASL